jgi:hypothetical protein
MNGSCTGAIKLAIGSLLLYAAFAVALRFGILPLEALAVIALAGASGVFVGWRL